MFAWLMSALLGIGDIWTLLDRVKNVIVGFANSLLSIFRRWVQAAAWAARAFSVGATAVWRTMSRLVDFAGHVVFVIIPRTLGEAFRQATTWASRELSLLRSTASGWVASAITFARTEIGRLRTSITNNVRALTGNIGQLWSRFLRVEGRVIQLLTDHRAMADWIAGQVLSAIGRWAVGRAHWIGRWLLTRSLSSTLWVADLLEHVVVDLFL